MHLLCWNICLFVLIIIFDGLSTSFCLASLSSETTTTTTKSCSKSIDATGKYIRTCCRVAQVELFFSYSFSTYGSEENVDVLRPCVDDNIVDVSLLDLAQHLAVSVDCSLSDVNFHFARRRSSNQILQPQ